MRKLLLFIMVLFGILSVQSFAWNYGCGENIPPDVCEADGSKSGGGEPMSGDPYIGAIAFNKDTGAGYNTRVKRANEKALKKCEKNGGQNCKVIVNVCAVEGTTKY